MKMMMKAVAAVAALALGGAACADQLVDNGSFESGSFAGWTRSGNLGYTTVSAAPAGPAYGATSDGAWFANIGPVGSDGVLAQTLATVAGQHYTVSWDLAASPSAGAPNDFAARFGDATLFGFVDQRAPGDAQFVHYRYDAVATGADTLLQFSFRQDTSYMALDNVSVMTSPVPEPASGALILAGLGALGFAVRRRHQRVR